MVNKVRTIDFLPEIFRTEANRQFLNATLDVLTAQPNLQKIQGYIGNLYEIGINSNDVYIKEPTSVKQNYQFNPSVVFLKPDTGIAQDFIDYPGLIKSLQNHGAEVDNNSRLFESEFYSWDPFVDLDKIVNYAQYHWIPRGPDAIPMPSGINVSTSILGQSNYTSTSGIVFTNGLKVSFPSGTIPSFYANKSFYVEGVGSSINLLLSDAFIVPEPTGNSIFNPYDISGYDVDNWDVDLFISSTPDYITISRNSLTLNAWSRSNRWFHQNVLDTTYAALGRISSISDNQPSRARRPIIEFRGNLQLFNSGRVGNSPIKLLDTITTDPSQISGQSSYTVDGITLNDGDRIVLANASLSTNRSNVYLVSFTGPSNSRVLSLTVDSSVSPIQDETQVVVTSGVINAGTSWRFDSGTAQWIKCQQKTLINQAPLFDVFTKNGTSYSNSSVYPGTTFAGTKIFSFAPSNNGVNDTILGFPISYSGVNNIGDISFEVNLNTDTFTYIAENGFTATMAVNTGFIHENTSASAFQQKTGWVKAADNTIQYQVFTFIATSDNQKNFVLDVPVTTETAWSPIQIYVENTLLSRTDFTVSLADSKTITLDTGVPIGTALTILVASDLVSKNSYYSIPSNLSSNPFNSNVTTVDVGDLRNQYRSIFANLTTVNGLLFGNNNIHDLGNVLQYGTSIIKNSASLALPGLFLRKPDVDFFSALEYNAKQYQTYKDLLIQIAGKNDYSIQQTPQEILDSIIYEISTIRDKSDSFFWTDMLPSGSSIRTKTYKITVAINSVIYNLSRIYDYNNANYFGLTVYLTRVIDGIARQRQLIRGIDYTVNSMNPSVTIHTEMLSEDTITIKEYTQTYGSYCPSTPSSLGLYPATVPKVILDTSGSSPTYFIVGHDGSWNKLYGSYVTSQLDDFRDIALLEFETRIYNNIKTSAQDSLLLADVLPGQFRSTEYSYEELQRVYHKQFINWVGSNRLDYRLQSYSALNQFTYNYSQSSNKIDSTQLLQGYWRGLYKYFFDTENPSVTPWEMLGHSDKPNWWDTHYSWTNPSKRTALVTALTNGLTKEPPSSYVDTRYARPGFASIVPVDSSGNLLSPLACVVSNYNKISFSNRWEVGDGAPIESTYWKSSQWPFDAMRILALTKPAKFFNLLVDLDQYAYDDTLQQYLYDGRQHLNPKTLDVYGSGIAKHSYINWIVDYINQRGVNGNEIVLQYLRNMDVRLTHNMAGFTSKQHLKFYIERATPNSRNASLLIPDENYSILLYDNQPEKIIRYSSIVIQRTDNGYTVYGNSTTENYFTIQKSQDNSVTKKIEAEGATVKIPLDFYDSTSIVPYGTTFYSQQAVCDFITAYGKYLSNQGVSFANIYDEVVYDWNRICLEFLVWSQQSWASGSTIALNPNSKKFVVDSDGLVVQPLTLSDKNFILNQNLLPIQQQNSAVYRENTKFTVKILNDGDTVSYTNLHLNSIEHAVVFDNVTSFNDTIYNLVTGLRQNKLMLKGYKTANWQGYVDANGFILSEDNIQQWKSSKKYAKGSIVEHKDRYWIATKLIEPSALFSQNDWQSISYDRIKLGLLPNSSTQSAESLIYYDSNVANLELDADLLSFGLIGYRPRDYMAAADLTDITQVNIFKNLIRGKGTTNVSNSFRFANFNQRQIDYKIHENWAMNVASFGAVLSNNFVESKLDESVLVGNPTVIGFTDSDSTVESAQQTISITNLINWGRMPESANFLPKYSYSSITYSGLPTAGYVHSDDPTISVFKYDDLQLDSDNVNKLLVNSTVWIANHKNSWNIFGGQSANNTLIQFENNLNGTATLIFSSMHNLVVGDEFLVVSFDENVNGFYSVKSIKNIFSVVVTYSSNSGNIKITGQGAVVKLQSRRFAQSSDVANAEFPYMGLRPRTVWVDSMQNNSWAVLDCKMPYNIVSSIPKTINAGTAVAYSSAIGYIFGNSAAGLVYIAKNSGEISSINSPVEGFGNIIKATETHVIIGTFVSLFIYTIDSANATLLNTQTINQFSASNIYGIDCSANNDWLYTVSDIDLRVYLRRDGVYSLVNTIPITGAESLSCSSDGVKLVVGCPVLTTVGLSASGKTYVYSRGLERFFVSNTQTSFTLKQTPPSNAIKVLVNGIERTNFVLSGNTIIFTTSIPAGSIVTVEYGSLLLQQILESKNPKIGGKFGQSVSTNRYGADLVVGAPYETITNNTSSVEGAVYKYTNSGQRYGIVTSDKPSVQANDLIYINGYAVRFSDNTDVASSISDQINDQTPTNIIASASLDTLTITVMDNTIETLYNVLDIVGSIDVLGRLKFSLYSPTQTIVNYNKSSSGAFGYRVRMNEQDGLVVSAPTTKKIGAVTFDYSKNIINVDSTQFDYTDNQVPDDTVFDTDLTIFDLGPNYGNALEGDGTVFDNDTTALIDELREVSTTTFDELGLETGGETLFDSGTTIFDDEVTRFDVTQVAIVGFSGDTDFDWGSTLFDATANIGMVYQYDYLPASNENIKNTGQYVFGQYVLSDSTYSPDVNFGASVDMRNNQIVVGAINIANPTNGNVFAFASDSNSSSWRIQKTSIDVVDINRVSNISLYNEQTGNTLQFLDYCDPYQGKLLGSTATNIDYISSMDPAGYANTRLQWGENQVGLTWFDTSNYRLMNYYQTDLDYNAKNWGKAFTGSSADIYTWIKSTESPLDYTGRGTVTNFENYVTTEEYVPSQNSLATYYYFWVRDYDAVPRGKTVSPVSVSRQLIDPRNSGVAFFAPLTTNAVALFNSNNYIRDNSTVIHIGFGNSSNSDNAQLKWELLQTNKKESFLSGFPNTSSDDPSGLYLKFIDSFCGYDLDGNAVPDPRLPKILQSGVGFRPRQSMFTNRILALENYIKYANTIASKYPVREIVNLNFLNKYNDVNGPIVHPRVRAATTVSIAAVYNNAITGVGATLNGTGSLPAIDNVALQVGDRVLIKNQTIQTQNGIYIVDSIGPVTWKLTRSYDFNGGDSGFVQFGDTVTVRGGLTQSNTTWMVSSVGNVTFGQTNITFASIPNNSPPVSSQSIFDTRDYWDYVDWWAEGYSSSTKPVLEVNSYSDLLKITDQSLISGTNGLVLTLNNGLIVRVQKNSQGLSEVYSYKSTDQSWVRIGLEKGTIKISDKLWTSVYGFDWTAFSSPEDRFEKTIMNETRWIIRWINEYLYSADLLAERNASLTLMFNYIKSESFTQTNYGQWLMKTSFIDVEHKIRNLEQYRNYQRDNTEFLTGFINEVKPYHVVIKDFIYKYEGSDVVATNVTDFDLPAKYNSKTGKFESPQFNYKLQVNTSIIPAALLSAIVGTEPQQTLFVNTTIAGRKLADITNDGSVSMADYLAYQNYINNPSANLAAYNTYIETVMNPYILANPTVYSAYIKTENSDVWDSSEYKSWLDNYGLTFNTAGIMQKFGYLKTAIGNTNTLLTLYSTTGLESSGIIQIDNEKISYNGISQNTLLNCQRGVDGTLPVAHVANTSVSVRIKPIMVVHGGRGYTTTPTVTISNPVGYVSPRVNATAIAVLASIGGIPGAVAEIKMTSLGSGYPVEPIVKISSSPINATFVGANINTTTNTITISNHVLLTGDPVVFTSATGANIYGLQNDRYYYVAKLDSNTIALYYDLEAAREAALPNLPFPNPPRKIGSLDEERVKLNNVETTIGTLAVTAKLAWHTCTNLLRSFKTTILYDRVSYSAKIGTQNTAAERITQFYAPTVNMPGKDLGQLLSGVEYPNNTIMGKQFTDLTPEETKLDSSPANDFLITNSSFTVSGGQFADGYAPEELVPSVVTDSFQAKVTSDDLQPLSGIGYIVAVGNFSGVISSTLPQFTTQVFDNVNISGGSGAGARARVTFIVNPSQLNIQGPGAATQNTFVEIVYPNTGLAYKQYQVGDVITITGNQLGGSQITNDLTMQVVSVGGRAWSYVLSVNRFGIPQVAAGTTINGAKIDMSFYNKSWYEITVGTTTSRNCRLSESQHPVAVFLRNNQ